MKSLFFALAVVVAFAGVALLAQARKRLGHDARDVRRTAIVGVVAMTAWIALSLVVASSGVLSRFDLRPPPMVLLMLVVLIGGVVLAFSRVGDMLASGA